MFECPKPVEGDMRPRSLGWPIPPEGQRFRYRDDMSNYEFFRRLERWQK